MDTAPPPLSGTATAPRDLPRTIGFLGAAGILIGVTIGGGIFRKPPEIAGLMSSPTLILCVWAAGGVLSLFGALTYAELATMFPRSGGLYNFLYQSYGRSTAFVFGWSYMLIIKPMGAGGIAIVFAEIMEPWFGYHVSREAIACLAFVVLTAINILGMRLGSGINVALTAFKVLSLLAIVGLALVMQKGDVANLNAVASVKPWHLALAPVLAMVLWTYDGWSDVGAVAGEVKNPQRNLPRIYAIGTAAMILLYGAVNAVYMWLVPLEQMRTPEIKANFAGHVMGLLTGAAGAGLMTAIVVVSTIGSTHASLMTGARVTFAQAQDGLLFRFLGRVHPKFQTPDVSLIVQLFFSCVAVLFLKTFESLTNSFVFTMWIFYGLAAAGVIVLRIRRPELERPFRVTLYPIVPGVFILVSAWMTGTELVRAWEDGDYKPFLWVGVLGVGYPMYFVWNAVTGAAGRSRTL